MAMNKINQKNNMTLQSEPIIKEGDIYVGTTKDGFHLVEHKEEMASDKTRYSESASRVNKVLWGCRRDRERGKTQSSAKEDILQRIWNKIVEETLDRQEVMKKCPGKFSDDFAILDEAYVDGTIYQICNEYERELEAFEKSQWIFNSIAFEIISKNFEEFRKAICYCRHELISLNGRQRFGFMSVDFG